MRERPDVELGFSFFPLRRCFLNAALVVSSVFDAVFKTGYHFFFFLFPGSGSHLLMALVRNSDFSSPVPLLTCTWK